MKHLHTYSLPFISNHSEDDSILSIQNISDEDATKETPVFSPMMPLDFSVEFILNQISDALIICDQNLHITYWNHPAQRMYGWTAAEAVGQHIDVLLKTTWTKTPQAKAISTLIEKGTWQGEVQQQTKTGETLVIWAGVSWLKDADGEIIGGISVNRDIANDQQIKTVTQERQRLEVILKKEREWSGSIERMIQALFHDLRVPLAVISTSTGLLNRYGDKFPPELRSEKYSAIQAQVRHMKKMIDDAALMLHGSLNEMTYQPRIVNLAQLCEVCVGEIRDTIATSNHKLVFETDGEISYVKLDDTLITRILINLLTNAIKYSPQGGMVKLTLTREGNDIVLDISDQGIGISAEDQGRIFEIFFRSENVQEMSGAGLGLSIVYDCVKMHGGQISVRSNVNVGTTFTVRLPYLTLENDTPTSH